MISLQNLAFLASQAAGPFPLDSDRISDQFRSWKCTDSLQKNSFDFFFEQSETDFLEIRFRRSTSTAMNGENKFPGNSFPGYEENPISGISPILDSCRIGLQLNAANEFPGN